MLRQDKTLLFSHPSVRQVMLCFKHTTFSCLEKASMLVQIFLYRAACLRHVVPHTEQWLSSSQPPTSASVPSTLAFCKCRLLYALFFLGFLGFVFFLISAELSILKLEQSPLDPLGVPLLI